MFVVAYLRKAYDEGFIALEDIEEQIRAMIVKEKKSSIIVKSISSTDLTSIASANQTTVVKDKKAIFGNPNIEGVGYEPELVGSIFAISKGNTSSPIIGKNAVYVVDVINIDEDSNGDFKTLKSNLRLNNNISSYYNALKKAAKVEDNRSDFY